MATKLKKKPIILGHNKKGGLTEDKVDIELILSNLKYLRDVKARRNTYHVFRGLKHYLVTSMKSAAAGFFSVVDRVAVDYVAQRFSGRTVTNPELSKNKSIIGRFHEDFQVLNCLYALVAEGRAKINSRLTTDRSGPIFFDIKVYKTPAEIARWMSTQLDDFDELYQLDTARKIAKMYGPNFVYRDAEGNLAIDRRILYHFRKLTKDNVVWVTQHGGGYYVDAHWRKRERYDAPGRTQYID